MRTKLLLVLLLIGAPGGNALAADATEGGKLAVEVCARCHDVASGGRFKTYPPSFASIGTYRSQEQILARIWFPPMHAPMPSAAQVLSRKDVEDLVAYIVSLDGSAR